MRSAVPLEHRVFYQAETLLKPKVRGPFGGSAILPWRGKIKRMRAFVISWVGLVLAVLSLPAFAAREDAADSASPVSCGNGVPGGINCIPSQKDLKAARN